MFATVGRFSDKFHNETIKNLDHFAFEESIGDVITF